MAQSSYSRTTARDTSNSNDMVYQVANKERMLAPCPAMSPMAIPQRLPLASR